jgi:putative glutamine amidotransferase
MEPMTRPRIAIPIPTSSNADYNQRSWPSYAAAVEGAGGEAVRVELSGSTRTLREAARNCSGILLPGSPADVLPSRYGADADPATNKADEAREAADWTLLEEAERNRLPVLGICYGLQSLNVYRGGSLVQDLSPLPVNHEAGRAVAVAHIAEIALESVMGGIARDGEAVQVASFVRVGVNSSHHQAVAAVGEGLRVVARCPEDGVVEAVEGAGAGPLLLGVQWHPERSYESSAASRLLFDRLVAEARRRG